MGINENLSLVPLRKNLLAVKLQSKQRNKAESPQNISHDMTSTCDHMSGKGLARPEKDNPILYKVAKQNKEWKKGEEKGRTKLNKGFPNSEKFRSAS